MSNFCITEHINSCFVAPGFQTPLCTQFNATWLSHQSWLPLWLRGIWHAIGPRVFVRVCAHAWDSKGNESRCHCWASASRECRDAEGKVTCLSVCQERSVSDCRRWLPSGMLCPLHAVWGHHATNNQSEMLTVGKTLFELQPVISLPRNWGCCCCFPLSFFLFKEVSNYIQILAYGRS